MDRQNDLASNLRHLCAEEKSVSQICRTLQINRQQFAKYLNGGARPSANNLRRICRYFGVPETDIDLPHDAFVRRGQSPRSAAPEESIMSAFRETAPQARRLIGRYHGHYMSPSYPGQVVRDLIQISERNGLVVSATVGRLQYVGLGQIGRIRFDGLVSMQDDTYFVVERDTQFLTGFAQTIVRPAQRGSQKWLYGQLLGYPWQDRVPFSTPCVWKQLRAVDSMRKALSDCGAFPMNSKELDPVVRKHFEGKAPTVG